MSEADERRARVRAELAAYEREQRDARLRRGKGRPRTQREMRIFAADLLARDVRTFEAQKESGVTP